MDLFYRSPGSNDRSEDDKSQQVHTVVRQATVGRFLNRRQISVN